MDKKEIEIIKKYIDFYRYNGKSYLVFKNPNDRGETKINKEDNDFFINFFEWNKKVK